MLSALYAIAHPSVRLSVRWVYYRKMVEVRVMKFSPHSSPIRLDFLRDKFHPEILRVPRVGASNKGGWVKSAVFYP